MTTTCGITAQIQKMKQYMETQRQLDMPADIINNTRLGMLASLRTQISNAKIDIDAATALNRELASSGLDAEMKRELASCIGEQTLSVQPRGGLGGTDGKTQKMSCPWAFFNTEDELIFGDPCRSATDESPAPTGGEVPQSECFREVGSIPR